MVSTLCLDTLELLIAKQKLPPGFLNQCRKYYAPLSQKLAQLAGSKKPLLIGIQGVQGSGKSTAAIFIKAILESEHKLRVAVASIDDFYLTRQQRSVLAKEVHPLFKTRGVPGTHDVDLIASMFDAAERGENFRVPIFDKAVDDRSLRVSRFDVPVDIVIFEGWCVGLSSQNSSELIEPVNELERLKDSKLLWRRHVNAVLEKDYAPLFSRLDRLVALHVPGFESVYGWRLLQEKKLIAERKRNAKSIENTQSPEQIRQFIEYFERLSRHALNTMPRSADFLLKLNGDHNIEDLVVIERA